MNTPPTPKRFKGLPPVPARKGWFKHGLHKPNFASEFAEITSKFVFLEEDMRYVLAALLGTTDLATAGYVLRAIKSPKGRIDLMMDLLQLAPQNANRGPEWDFYVREFSRISGLRNNLVHGQWWTAEDDTVWVAEFDEHGVGFRTKREVELRELHRLDSAIGNLQMLIRQEVAPLFHEQSPPPKPR